MQGQTQISTFQMKNSPLSHHSQASKTILEQNYLLLIGSREILKSIQKKRYPNKRHEQSHIPEIQVIYYQKVGKEPTASSHSAQF